MALALTLAVYLYLTKTRSGLMLRVVGQNPEATFAVGTNPVSVGVSAIVVGGAFAGLGSTVLAPQEVGNFTDA